MFTRLFLKRAAERALKSAAQAAILIFGADQVDWFNVDFGRAGAAVVAAAVLSFLMSVVSIPGGDDLDSPSMVG